MRLTSLHRLELRRTRRRGFTMIELLVVITIIVLVISSVVAVYANFIQVAREQATRTTIQKIDEILKQRLEAFRKRDLTDAANRLVQSGAAADLPKGKVLAFKMQFRALFPQSSSDNTKPPYDQISSLTNTNARSSAYLYAIVTKGPTFGTPSVDDSTFSSTEIRTDAATGVTYFVDAWGEPLRFYRSPTRLFWPGEDVNGNGTLDSGEDLDADSALTPPTADLTYYSQARNILASNIRFTKAGSLVDPLRIDSDDSLGRLSPSAGNNWKTFETTYQTPSVFSAPLIVSAGPDRQLGLLEPTDTSTQGSQRALLDPSSLSNSLSLLTDNITNLNLRAGGNN